MAEDTVIDVTSEEVIPYLIHFSKKGIVPPILGIKDFRIKMKKIEGERLFKLLSSQRLPKNLSQTYARLGRNVSYMNKCGVTHWDLHTGNVVVSGGVPYIIDWETGSRLTCPSEHIDKTEFLTFTQNHLSFCGRENIFPYLERTFNQNYDFERSIPLDVSHEQIEEEALREENFSVRPIRKIWAFLRDNY